MRAVAQNLARERWGTQLGFLIAAIGSAIGLGNIWRFPGVAYENGGGAFILPYIVALFTAGMPFLLFDYALGHRYQGAAPTVFRRLSRWWEGIGWFQVIVSFVIMTYYAVVVAWSISYMFFSVKKVWGEDPVKFFVNDYLQLKPAGDYSFTLVPQVFLPLLVVWVGVMVLVSLGVRRGIEKANKIFIPLLVILFVAMVVRSLSLPGASMGLHEFFNPNWSALLVPKVWVAAYTQIFYSLSVGFGIMLTYASYLPRKANLAPTAMVAAFANSSFEILAGIGVFATLGFMASEQGVQVSELKNISSVSLSFMTFPKVISMMPGGAIFGVLFFASLTIAGITSLISLVQVVAGALQDKFHFSRIGSALIAAGSALIISISLFATQNGINALDVVDYWINSVALLGIAVLSVLYVSLVKRKMRILRLHISYVSTFSLGRWWEFMTAWLTPLVLLYILGATILDLLHKGYSPDYSSGFQNIFGWGSVLFALVITIIFTVLPWKGGDHNDDFTPTYSEAELEAWAKKEKLR